jgi:hypothetical protein
MANILIKRSFILILMLLCCCGSYAATSPNYAISIEVMDLGGASMESPGYRLHGKLRDNIPIVITSPSFTIEGRFMGMVYGTGTYITAETPVVRAIIPHVGYNNALYRVVINGWLISSDAGASLTASSQPTISGTTVTIESSTSMECTFDLSNASAGARNVVVTNTGYGKVGVLAAGFTVQSPGKVDVIGTPSNDPNPFNPANGPTMIKYKLTTSAAISLYLFNLKGALIWQKSIPAGDNGGSAGDNSVAWNAISYFDQQVPTGVYILSIVSNSGGSSRELGRIKIAVLRQ